MEIEEFKELVHKKLESFNKLIHNHVELNDKAFSYFVNILNKCESSDSTKLNSIMAQVGMLAMMRNIVEISIDTLVTSTDTVGTKDLHQFISNVFLKTKSVKQPQVDQIDPVK